MKLAVIEQSDSRWFEILLGLKYDIYHHPAYLASEDLYRGSQTRLFVVQDNDLQLVIPLALSVIPQSDGLADASSPYGYPAPLVAPGTDLSWVEQAIGFLIVSLGEMGVVSLFVRFHPLIGLSPGSFDPFGTLVAHGSTVSIQLGRSFEEIRADMRSGHRYEIRRALRQGQVSTFDRSWAHLSDFVDIYTESMNRVGAGRNYYFSRAYFEFIRDNLPDHVFLWTTMIDNEVAAASLVTHCNGIVQFHLSGTRDVYYRQHPTKVLLDAVAQYANDCGASRLHLGGGLGAQEDDLFRFKAGFSKDRHMFSTARVVVLQDQYDRLSQEWESQSDEKADSAEGFFPAYRKPTL